MNMIFAEIKPQIEQLPHEEMLKTMAYLKVLLRSNSPEHQQDLAQRHADIDAGRKLKLEDAKKTLNLD